MPVRRLLWVWCVALIVVGSGAVAGEAGLPVSTSLRTGAPSAGMDTPVIDPVAVLPDASVDATTGAASSLPTPLPPVVAAPTMPGSGAPAASASPPGSVPTAPPSTRPPVEPDGLMPCTVKVDDSGSTIATGSAVAGSPALPLFVENCRPIAGDFVAVYALAVQPGEAVRVDFGDGTSAGRDPADPRCAMPAGQVRSEHRYQRPGRYLLERISWFPCKRHPPTVLRVWIDVAGGRVPQAAGAAPCHGLGPVKAGEPARHGWAQRDVPNLQFHTRVHLSRCSVAVGAQSELVLPWYQPKALVDWGDGTSLEAVDGKGQGANVLHTHSGAGLRAVTVRVVGADGQLGPPMTFTILVS